MHELKVIAVASVCVAGVLGMSALAFDWWMWHKRSGKPPVRNPRDW